MSGNFILKPTDELLHPAGPESNFNESAYSNAFDKQTGIGGWMRIGNRVNEGYAEKSVVLYLPDNKVAVAFGRPEITSNDAFNAGGIIVTTPEPFKYQQMKYQGEIFILESPDRLRNPKTMFEGSQKLDCDIEWNHRSNNPLHGGVPADNNQETFYGPEFSQGHFNQHTSVTGHIRVGDNEYSMDGHGWRDHSWGPRFWDNIFCYRLFLATFDDSNALMFLKIYSPDGRARSLGALLLDGQFHDVRDLNVHTDWTAEKDPKSVNITMRTAEKTYGVEVEILNTAPLRNRREAKDGSQIMTRICESHSRFHMDGKTAWGMTEYIERVENGEYVGYPA